MTKRFSFVFQLHKALLEEVLVWFTRETPGYTRSCLRWRKSVLGWCVSSMDVPSLQNGQFSWRWSEFFACCLVVFNIMKRQRVVMFSEWEVISLHMDSNCFPTHVEWFCPRVWYLFLIYSCMPNSALQFHTTYLWSLRANWLIATRAYPGFCSMKRLEVFLLPLDGMLVHRRSLPHNLLGFPSNSQVPIYTPGWREALWEWSVLPRT